MNRIYQVHLFGQTNFKIGIESIGVGLIIVLLLNNDFTHFIENTSHLLNDLFATLVIGIFEETIFRVVVIFIIGVIFYNLKLKVYWKIYLSSLIFALAHLENMLSVGQSLQQTIIQIGYSFCLGTIFAISYLVTKNILYPMVLHFLADLISISLSSSGFVTDVQLDTISIVLLLMMVLITMGFNWYVLSNDQLPK